VLCGQKPIHVVGKLSPPNPLCNICQQGKKLGCLSHLTEYLSYLTVPLNRTVNHFNARENLALIGFGIDWSNCLFSPFITGRHHQKPPLDDLINSGSSVRWDGKCPFTPYSPPCRSERAKPSKKLRFSLDVFMYISKILRRLPSAANFFLHLPRFKRESSIPRHSLASVSSSPI